VGIIFCASAQDDVLKMRDGKLYLRVYNSWNQRTADSILALYDVKNLDVDLLRTDKSTGSLEREGWFFSKSKRNWIEIQRDFSSEKSDAWKATDVFVSDSSFAGDGSHLFTERVFGFNDFKFNSIAEMSNGMTRVFFRTNKNYQRVFLSGTFNLWSTGVTPMRRIDGGWEAVLDLIPGKHEYKFIADGKWLPDPDNNRRIDDGMNGYNSVYFKPNYTFELKGFTDAKEVVLTGSFNDWDEREIKMDKVTNGWRCALFLPVGTYAYKFKIDNEWITDPRNTDIRPDGAGNMNSFLNVGDPHMFRLLGFETAKQVLLSGTFNNWNSIGLVMKKVNGGWELPLALPADNYQYKFIVDGKWQCDSTQPTVRNAEDGEQNNIVSLGANHTFTYTNANANAVFVTGSFTSWMEPGIPMVKKDGVWSADVYVPTGRNTYKFVVDGQWMLDPANSLWEDNEFNTGNSILLKK
jgi:1,4-alpha-glucan branching enzyme